MPGMKIVGRLRLSAVIPKVRLAQWAFTNLAPEQRAEVVVYTSGEHCPMCSAAHGWAGLGRIVYAASCQQLAEWRAEFGEPAAELKELYRWAASVGGCRC